jgi:arylsulfatase A-like enzyme
MDEQVGRFLNVLRTRGLYDDATIVVTSDHGEEFWEHGGFEHGHSLYDELVHVPLIIKLSAHVDVNQKVIQNAVRVLDVMPTIFEAVGVDSPASFEGKSMLPIMRGERDEARAILMESTLYGPPKIAWRTERYKYIHDATAGPDGIGELYDLQADPGETQNVSAQQLETAKRLRKQLFDFYFELRRRSDQMSAPDPVDLSPTRIRQLKSLGYIR